jgi:hypothetical protein
MRWWNVEVAEINQVMGVGGLETNQKTVDPCQRKCPMTPSVADCKQYYRALQASRRLLMIDIEQRHLSMP